MAVRDLLWACPICRTPGSIRPDGRRERCHSCHTRFRRGAGARIIADRGVARDDRTAAEWLRVLGPVEAPAADGEGRILGPEVVRVKVTRIQKPLHFGGELIGWVEVYEKALAGTMTLRVDGLHFTTPAGASLHWQPADLTGLQPASSSIQLGLHRHMASVKFIEGSVRLWTRALSDLLRDYYRQIGRDVLELQPSVRTCALTRTEA